MKTLHYINLTNGILAIPEYDLTEYRFIRIQSTWCEQGRWEDILMTLSDDFLMNLVLGNNCIVYDYGARKRTPRAVWQGLAWISLVLHTVWFNTPQEFFYQKVRRGGIPLLHYFYHQYHDLSDKCLNKIKYYRKFTTGEFHLHAIVDSTLLDNETELFKDILRKAENDQTN